MSARPVPISISRMQIRYFLIAYISIFFGASISGAFEKAVAAPGGSATKSGAAARQITQKQSKTANITSRQAKNTALRKKSVARAANRLVPPPPAYMPTILPELYFRKVVDSQAESSENAVEAKPANPYNKYFYSADNAVPKAVQARSGVTTWVPNQQ